MSPRRIPRFINVTHAEVANSAAVERQRDAADELAKKIQEREAKDREEWRALEKIPRQYRPRRSATYEPDHPEGFSGYAETFSCGCDKPEHGHNPYAGIIEPTRLEFVDPDEEARKLRERVDRARPQTPPAAKAIHPGGGGRTPHTGRPMRR